MMPADNHAARDLIDALDRPAPVAVRSSNGVHQEVVPPAVGSGDGPDAAPAAKGSNGVNPETVDASVVEAALLLEGHPATPARLSRITGLSVPEIERCLATLRTRYAAPHYGLQITRVADSYSLTPKAELWERLRHHYGNGSGKRLSRAAMETLTIVAYSQPVTRSEIESIRGVSPDAMLRVLGERDLICEVGRKEVPGRPIQYGTSAEFLRVFGLTSIADLPKLTDADRARFKAADE